MSGFVALQINVCCLDNLRLAWVRDARVHVCCFFLLYMFSYRIVWLWTCFLMCVYVLFCAVCCVCCVVWYVRVCAYVSVCVCVVFLACECLRRVYSECGCVCLASLCV